LKAMNRKEAMHALFTTKSPFERTLTREKGGKARFNYELCNAEGVVLQGCDKLESLLKNVSEKRHCSIVRTKDGVTVYPTEQT